MTYNYAYSLLLSGLLTALAFTAQAQKRPAQGKKKPQSYWDVLYLRNGSIIKGTIFDSSSAGVKMETRLQDTLVYASQEVERITRVPKPLKVSPRGFYGIMEAGIQFGEAQGAVLRAIGGYRFNWQWQAGIGIGLDDYSVQSAPVFADLRYDFSRKDHTLFAYTGAGASIPWPTKSQKVWSDINDKKPGLYLHAGLGYKIRLQHNRSVHISAGYTHADMAIEYVWEDITYRTYNYSYNRVTIVLGYSF